MALDLEAIKARLAATTPTAAEVEAAAKAWINATWVDGLGPAWINMPEHWREKVRQRMGMALIAANHAAPADVAALLAEVERLRALLSETRPGRALDL